MFDNCYNCSAADAVIQMMGRHMCSRCLTLIADGAIDEVVAIGKADTRRDMPQPDLEYDDQIVDGLLRTQYLAMCQMIGRSPS